MNIKIRDFILIQQEYWFDLKRIVKSRKIGDGTIQNPTGEEYEREIDYGYNMTLPTCIEKIVHLTLLDNNMLVEWKDYVSQYKSIVNDINNVLKSNE